MLEPTSQRVSTYLYADDQPSRFVDPSGTTVQAVGDSRQAAAAASSRVSLLGVDRSDENRPCDMFPLGGCLPTGTQHDLYAGSGTHYVRAAVALAVGLVIIAAPEAVALGARSAAIAEMRGVIRDIIARFAGTQFERAAARDVLSKRADAAELEMARAIEKPFTNTSNYVARVVYAYVRGFIRGY